MNRLTDCYNAVSVLHQIPVGGEDLTRYAGPPRLIRAAGDRALRHHGRRHRGDRAPRGRRGGVVRRCLRHLPVLETGARPAAPSCARTPPTALFILEGLDPVTSEALHAAADDLARPPDPARAPRPGRPPPDSNLLRRR